MPGILPLQGIGALVARRAPKTCKETHMREGKGILAIAIRRPDAKSAVSNGAPRDWRGG